MSNDQDTEAARKAAAAKKAAAEKARRKAERGPEITVEQFIESPAHAVPVSGLLVAHPELRAKSLTRSQWEGKLDAYLRSPRP